MKPGQLHNRRKVNNRKPECFPIFEFFLIHFSLTVVDFSSRPMSVRGSLIRMEVSRIRTDTSVLTPDSLGHVLFSLSALGILMNKPFKMS